MKQESGPAFDAIGLTLAMEILGVVTDFVPSTFYEDLANLAPLRCEMCQFFG